MIAKVLLAICLALSTGAEMAKAKAKKAPADLRALAQTVAKKDLKWFYREVLIDDNDQYQRSLGRLHDYLFDFLRWEELLSLPQELRHSRLHEFLPAKGEAKWVYFPSLYRDPEVYTGDDHPLAQSYLDGKLIKGVLFRLCGSGRFKAVLLPREHLKSEIANKAFVLQEIIRDPSVRIMCRTHTMDLSDMMVDQVKAAFDGDAFREFFGDLKPDNKEAKWSREEIQVRCQRRGKEPTLFSSSLKKDVTGLHPDILILDDVVGEENVDRQDWVRSRVQALAFVLKANGRLLDIGTRWAEDDAHGLFLRPGIQGARTPYNYTSFMLATVRDGDDKPIWPEVFSEEVLEEKHALCSSDYTWYCQFYNNPYLVKAQRFDASWIRTYTENPVDLVEQKELDIVITIDPASTNHKQSDYSAVVVQGQSKDAEFRYLLDGFRCKYDKATLPAKIVELCAKWQTVARRAKVDFKVGIEEAGFQTYLSYPLEIERRKLGLAWTEEPLKHQNRNKADRIFRLAQPFKTGAVLWPANLPCVDQDGKAYDLVEVLRSQYIRFPYCQEHEWDLLDALAYGEDLLRPLPMKAKLRSPEAKPQEKDIYRRDANNTPVRRPGRYQPLSDRYAQKAREAVRRIGGRALA